MTRLTLALTAWMSLVSVVSAALTPRKEPPTVGNEVGQAKAAKIATEAREQAAGRVTNSEFVLTDQTEVLLNGKPCRYEKVPGDASIVQMELAADNKTVLKIHFRSRK
jgi:hypothetical protein